MDMLSQQSRGELLFYCNPAFSNGTVFLHQCAVMFARGASVVVLIPSWTWDGFKKLYPTFVEAFCQVTTVNHAQFGNMKAELRGVVLELVFMVQPWLWERKYNNEI